ncbi:Endochitinase 33 [Beauveria bassiana]|uniref:Endochitinase 33 n=1 Tax=Beauveria bassiana TaxID=176275 RepID=A0A2N6ND69_BEABA|nr:Endochitinase 33 [Beauveria bassiana]
MGGGNSPSPNWVDAADAEKSSQLIWDMFGPVTSSKVDRPFGTSVVNEFDLEFETPVNHLSAFADRLRHLMDSATDKFYLSAAPLP